MAGLELENKNGLFVYGESRCLGYLIDFPGHGVYDAEHGRVDVPREDMDRHNEILDKMMIKGLDENCEIGQGHNFYVIGDKVKTFLGVELGDARIRGSACSFTRKGKTFFAEISEEHEVAYFERIA
jgi:hypothetical protein